MEKKDISYYETLGIPETSTQSQIKRAYYLRAKDCHPDKHPDDPAAEEMFKAITEAYGILSDETKKELYDRLGKSGLKKEEARATKDSMEIYKGMFGGGKFNDTFGELTFFQTLFTNSGTNPEEQRKKQFEILKKQDEQKRKIMNQLVVKLEPYATGAFDAFEDMMTIAIAYKLEAPGGPALLKLVGQIYVDVASQYTGGLGGFFSSIVEKGTFASQFFTAISSTIKLHSANQGLEQDAATQAQSMTASIDAIWELGKIEISRLLYEVCKVVLSESGVAPDMLKGRAAGLLKLGEMYIEAATQAQLIRKKSTEYDIPEVLSTRL